MEIKLIRSKTDYEAALIEIENLTGAEPDTPEMDRLEVLATFVQIYEDMHYDLPPRNPIDALEYYLESRQLSRKDLKPYIGSRDASQRF